MAASVFINNVADLDYLAMLGRIEPEIHTSHIAWVLSGRNIRLSTAAKLLALTETARVGLH